MRAIRDQQRDGAVDDRAHLGGLALERLDRARARTRPPPRARSSRRSAAGSAPLRQRARPSRGSSSFARSPAGSPSQARDGAATVVVGLDVAADHGASVTGRPMDAQVDAPADARAERVERPAPERDLARARAARPSRIA